MISIAYCTSLYSSRGLGPATIAQYLQRYDRDKLHMTFFTDDHSAGIAGREVLLSNHPLLYRLPGYWLLRSWMMYKALSGRRSSFDIIIFSNAFEAFFFALFGPPLAWIVMINDDNYLYTHYNFRKAIKQYQWMKVIFRYWGFYLEHFVAGKSSKVIACSEYLKKEIIHKYKVPPHNVEVLYPAVDIGFFHPKERSKEKDTINIFFMKSDWRRGGFHVLMEALQKSAHSSRISLCIAGYPRKDAGRISELLKKSGFKGEFRLLGMLQRQAVRDYMQEADIFVLPSLQEAFGTSQIEALASQTPVVASDAGGIPEALDGGKAGFMVKSGSAPELRKMIDKLCADPNLRTSKSESGYSYVKKFSPEMLYDKLEQICLNMFQEKTKNR